MKKMYVISSILILLLIISLISPIVISEDNPKDLIKTYGGERTDIAFSGIQTLDKGILLGGTTNSFSSAGFDFWVIKTNQSGKIQWDKYFGGGGDDSISSIIQNSDGSYILAGYSNSINDNDFDYFLIKMSAEGKIRWYKNYGGVKEDKTSCLINTSDGGYVLAGYSNSYNDDNFDFLILKTDNNGEFQWYKTYGGYKTDKASCIIQSDDGGFLIVGESNSFGAGGYDFWLVKTDSNGFMEWNRTFGGVNMEYPQSVIQSDDGGFLIVGESNSFGAGGYDFWLVKTDSNGFMEWNRTFGWKENDHAKSVVQMNDSSFLIAGYSEKFLSYGLQLYKTDRQGYLQCEKEFSSYVDMFLNSFFLTDDNKYLMTGFILSRNPNMDFLILKSNFSFFNKSNCYPISNAGLDEKVELNQELYFNATGFDYDGKIVKYRWDFNGDGKFDWESNKSESVTYSFPEEGLYRSYLEVTDNNNSVDIDMKIILVGSLEENEINFTFYSDPWIYYCMFFMIFCLFILVILSYFEIEIKYKNKLITKFFNKIYKIKKEIKYLLIIFLSLIIIKLIISLFFHNPFVYGDEFIYAVVAGKIFNGNFFILGNVVFSPVQIPTGYCYCLSPAYFFQNNMDMVYHIFLLINSIITSLIIFPVFFIMKKFVDKKLSIAASIIVGTLPIIMVHNFILFSENLFILLFLFSCYFVIKTFDYNKFNIRFIILSFFTGSLVGFLIMTRALGVAILGGLIVLVFFKLIKNKKISNLKYLLVFIPFIPAVIIGYFLYSDKIFFVGYQGSKYIEIAGIIISDFFNFVRFLNLIANEFNYFVIMSFIIFMAFTIFLLINKKKLATKKRNRLSDLIIFSFSSIFFLILITSTHIYSGDNSVYSRYVSPGLPIIFILGIIGMNLFYKIKIKNKYFVLASIIILLSFFYILLFPIEINSIVNNMDLIWINIAKSIYILELNILQLFKIILIFIMSISLLYLVYIYKNRKKLVLFKNFLNHKNLLFLFVIFLSILFFLPSLNLELKKQSSKDTVETEISKWFMQKDPGANIILEYKNGAFSGGGIKESSWHSIFVNMHFWLPKAKIKVMNRQNLTEFILSKNQSADYIVTTHDLSDYYYSVEDFYFDIWTWPLKKQPYVDWHIYKVK